MFESQLPQQNPLDTSLKSSFNNSDLNPESQSEILPFLRKNGELSLPKVEINNLTYSNFFSNYENLSHNFWYPSTIEIDYTSSPTSLTGHTQNTPLVYPLETNKDALLIAIDRSSSSHISFNSNTISGILQQDIYLTLQQFVQLPNFGQLMQSTFGDNLNTEKLNSITSQWQTGDFSKLPEIGVLEESVFPTNTLGVFAGATDKIYLSQGLLNSGNIAKIGDTIIEEIGHWLDKQLNLVDTPGDEGQMFAAVVRGKHLNENQIAEIRAEDDTTTIDVDGQYLKVEQATIVLPTITIKANDTKAGETLAGQTANPGQFTLTRKGDTASALTVNYTVAGTASNNTDYNKLTNSVTFAAGASTALINITPIDDGEFEGNETAIVTLATNTNYNLGTAKTATVNIADNDKPTITISATDVNAGETLAGQATNPGQFTLTRTGNNASALTVNYTVVGTATSSKDYTKLTNKVTFTAGSSTALINIAPIDDVALEDSETVIVNLATNANYNLGTSKSATINIADNDKPIITISATDPNASETLAGEPTNPGQFTLTRTGNIASALTVNYTIAGTATNSTDYSNLSGNATFIAGAATTVVTVIPKDDSVFEGNESVILTLAAGNAYTLGNAQTATVILMDNDLPKWNVSFINRNDSNYGDYNSYDFSRPNATLNLGWQNGFVYESTPFETLTVDSRTNVAPIGQPKVYSSVLEVGKRYRIEASGTWQYWTDNSPNSVVDARFQTDNAWNSQYNGNGGLFSTALSNGNDDIWGEYRPDHVYTYEILGNGQRVDFYISDSDYLNNQGAYTVKIYRESATPPTDNTIRLNANFGERNPAPNVQSDNFAMQAWTTTRLENGKTYQVTTNSDDGTRFFVKNLATGEVTNVGSEWRIRSESEPNMTLYFNVAQTGNYDFYVQGYDHLGASAFNVELKETPANSKPNHLGLLTDFNKDGKNDMLWRNYSTGENLAWALDDGSWIKDLDIEDVKDPAWYIVGTGDFNNDGNVDILWRYHWEQNTGHNVVWFMNGNQRISGVDLERVDDNNWHIVGTGDFNQDGNIDILWRNYFSGDNVIWNMKGTSHDNGITLEKQTDLNQRIVGTGDFNGDGKIDILWRNAATGTNSIWLMNGTSISSKVNFDSVTDLNWHIMGTADFNKDGKSDIICLS